MIKKYRYTTKEAGEILLRHERQYGKYDGEFNVDFDEKTGKINFIEISIDEANCTKDDVKEVEKE